MANVPELNELEAEVDTAFVLEMAQSLALQRYAEQFGRRACFLIWRLGFCSGQLAGLEKAKRVAA